MSKIIDDRVVEMRFDNSQFEKNVQTSINTLGNLKQSLNLSGAAKGLEEVDKTARGIDMSGLGSAVETVRSKFSALEVVGITALANITNSAVNAGKRLVMSLSVDQITAGWQKFSDKTTSVATLVAQGNALEDVNAQLDKLNWFTDETSYNFTDMVSNIAKFTATGKKLDESVTAMEGIATWAALSGQNAATASRAMYQISQAMGAGVMRLEDYKSIQNASMDTEEFRQKCLDAAVALGTLEKNADGTYESLVAVGDGGSEAFNISQFTSKLTAGAWLTSDVMMQVFNDYSSAVSGIYEAAEEKGMLASEVIDEIHKKAEKEGISTDEAIKSLGYNFDSFALKAFEAAQKARTFGDAIDSVKDAVSTGWMNTFSIIFGDAEEATELWTDLANAMYDVFASGAEARNEMLSGWKELGGRDDLIESFWNVWEGIGSIVKPIKEAFRDIFPPMTAERLAAFTKALKEFTAKLKLSDSASDKLKRTFKGLFAILSIIKQAFVAVFKAISPLFGGLDDLGGGILGVTAKIGDWLVKLNDTVKETNIFTKGINKIGDVLKIVGDALKKFFGFVKEKIGSPGLEAFQTLLERVKERMGDLGTVAEGMRDGIVRVFDAIGTALERGSFFKFLQTLWKVVTTIGSAIGKLLGGLLGGIVDKIGNANFSGILDFINTLTLSGIAVLIAKFVKGLKDIADSVGSFKDSAIGILDSVRGCFEAYQTKIKAGTLMQIAKAIALLVAAILVLSFIDSEKLDTALVAITALFAELLASMAIFTKISGKFSGVTKACTAMIVMSAAVLILAGALKSISSLSMEEIGRGLLGVAGLMGILIAVMASLSKFIKGSEKVFKISKEGLFSSKSKQNFISMGVAMIAIAAAMKILASAAKDLAELSWGDLAKGIAGIGVILAEMAGFTALIKAIKPEKMISTSIALIAIGASMKIFASAAKDFASMNWEELGKAGAAIAGILLAVAGFSKIVGNSEKIFRANKDGLFSKNSSQNLLSMSVALIAMGAAMKVFASAAKDFADMDWEGLAKVGAAIAGILLAVAGFMKIIPDSASMISAGAGLVIVAASMKIFASAVRDFADMDWEGLAKAGAAMAGILLMIGAFAKIVGGSSSIFKGGKDGFFSSTTSNGLLKTSAALLVLSVSMKIFASVMKSLASLSWESIGKGLATIAGAFVIIGVAGYALAPVVPAIIGLAGALALIGAAVLLAGAGIAAFGIGLTALATGLTAFGASLGVIVVGLVAVVKGFVVGIIEGIGEGIIALCKTIAGSAIAIGDAIKAVVLTLIDVLVECIPPLADGALKLIAGLLDALVEYTPQIVDSLFQFVIKILEGLGRNTPLLVQAIVNLLSDLFQGAIDALMSIDPDVFIKGSLAITLLAGMMAALAAVASLTPAAMVGVLGIVAVLAEFGAIAQIPGLSWLIGEGGELLSKIGEAIGGFVGGIVGGLMGGISNSLPMIAENLSLFMMNLQPFLDGAENIDQETLRGVNALVGTILALTGASLLERLTSWVTGGSSLAKFGEDIAAFGPSLKAYSDSVAGVDTEAIKASTEAARSLAEMASIIPNEGGVASWFAGDNSIAKFAPQLPVLGNGLKGFSDSVSGIVPENIIAAANAAKALAEMASIIPNEGGVASWFAGENSISKFGFDLIALGQGLKGFSDAIVGIVPENLIAASNAAKALAEMTATIPNEGGVASWFAGENSVSKFAGDLISLGGGLKGFSDAIVGVVPENLIAAANAARALAEMTSIIPNEGGVVSWFAGENSVSKFGFDLIALGQGLKGFSDAIVGIVPENIVAAANAARALADMASVIPNEGGVVSWFAGENSISKFGFDLIALGQGLKGFSDEIVGIVPENLVAASNAAKALAEMTAVIPSEGGVVSWFAGENSISKFAGELISLGHGLKGFSESVSGIIPENLVAASNAGKALAEMTSVIPKEGGIKAWFAGETSVSSFASKLPTLGKGLKGFSDSVAGIVAENITAAANAAKALAEMTAVIPKEGGIKAWFSGKSGVATFADKLPTLGDALKGFSDSVEGIKPENVTAAANAAKSLGEMTATVPKDTSKIGTFGTNLEKFGDKLASYFNKTKDISSESVSGAKNAVDSIKDIDKVNAGNIKSVSKAIDDLIDSIKGMAKITKASATNFRNALDELGKVSSKALLKPFKDIKSDMEKAGKNAIDAFIKGVKSKKSSVEAAAKEVANKSKDGIENKKSSFETAGRHLVEGFANGIENNAYKAEAKAKAMAQAAVDAVQKILKEHSPSKVGYSLGDFFGVAFVNAIGDYRDKAYETSAEMASSAKNGLGDSLNKLKNIIDGNIDVQPVIRPVLDLSDIRAGASSISEMLNANGPIGALASANNISAMMNGRSQNGAADDVVSAINKLRKDLGNVGNIYTIGDITYGDESNISDAVKSLVRAARVERRT